MRAISAILVVPFLALGACEADHTAARDWLSYRGYTRIEFFAVPVLGWPRGWHEPFGVGFIASADGKRWQGVVCASSEGLHDAHVPERPRQVGPAPYFDSFGARP